MQMGETRQLPYSRVHPEAVFDIESRNRKAQTILSVLKDHLSVPFNQLSVLDIGCSTGIITDALASHFKNVVGIDVDAHAIGFARSTFRRPNLEFRIQDGLALDGKEGGFEVAVCAHVYEHVPNAQRLMEEIYRVLSPGGVCYFAAGNRLAVREPHYGLPFLSWMPKKAAHAYIRVFGRGRLYDETHRTVWGLKRLVRGFRVHDYTRRLIETPHAFGLDYLLRVGTRRHRLAVLAVRHFYWLCPTYIWLLEKPVSSSG
jgi:2-polyprenyl-3-methyl-5-hydroxy-6-metoxy-1,4-benzoquinol methylase